MSIMKGTFEIVPCQNCGFGTSFHSSCGISDQIRIESLERENDLLREGKCLEVIPGTFVICGEGGNFCSEACLLRHKLYRAERIIESKVLNG